MLITMYGTSPMNSETSDSITTRQAVATDVLPLHEFIKPFVETGILLPRTIVELDELVEHGFVALRDNQIVGFAALEIYSSKMGEIRSLAVSAELQGQGVGRQLVQLCIDRARAQNVLEVMAITSQENFFRSCGFDFTLPGEKKALFVQTRGHAGDS